MLCDYLFIFDPVINLFSRLAISPAVPIVIALFKQYAEVDLFAVVVVAPQLDILI